MSIQKVNPRVGMYESLQLTEELLLPENIHTLKIFIDKRFAGPLDVYNSKQIDKDREPVKRLCIAFRHKGHSYVFKAGDVLVRDRVTDEIKGYEPAEYNRLYDNYPAAAIAELQRIGDFILANYANMIGMVVEGKQLETASEIVMFMLSSPPPGGSRRYPTPGKGSRLIIDIKPVDEPLIVKIENMRGEQLSISTVTPSE